nr:MAG TPA: hypothetical protein [Caudoviricetes sp.]
MVLYLKNKKAVKNENRAVFGHFRNRQAGKKSNQYSFFFILLYVVIVVINKE